MFVYLIEVGWGGPNGTIGLEEWQELVWTVCVSLGRPAQSTISTAKSMNLFLMKTDTACGLYHWECFPVSFFPILYSVPLIFK